MQESLFRSIQKPHQYSGQFDKAYAELNKHQKEAVDLIEGPVMVIAGPGTGKTQVLAVRIGKILKETQLDPHNILCLTFTDSASIEMRNRLVDIIGPAAHQVHIFTFHSFCNQVIQENMALFGGIRDLDVISELEKVEVIKEMLDGLSDEHPLKRLKGISSRDIYRIDKLFSLMKKENLTPQEFLPMIDDYLEMRRSDTSDKTLYYQINRKPNKKGDLKQNKWDDLVRSLNETRAAIGLFDQYQERLKKLGRYDYQDMILWVLDAFAKNASLLASYQERYQYFLVDEFQDTNGAQKEVLEYMVQFWPDNPNLFVVGDDDQAIYKFQGANLDNIAELYNRYHPTTIILEENYRSTQSILDGSHTLICHNEERLVNRDDNQLTKDLIASNPERKGITNPPRIVEYPNIFQEQAAITEWLTKANREGKNISDTAIIYRKHAQVDNIIHVLDKRNIPFNIKRRVDILKMPLIDCIVNILWYLQHEFELLGGGEDLLFKIMHYHFFHLSSEDVAKIAMHCGIQKDKSVILMRSAIGDNTVMSGAGIKDTKPFLSLHGKLDKWVSDIVNETLQGLLQNVLNEGDILSHIMSSQQRTWHLQVLTTFFDFIKKETSKNAELDLRQLLEMIDNMKSNRIDLGLNRVIHSREGAQFLTAHAAKGMEFDKVFIIGATENVWDKARKNTYNFKVPDSVHQNSEVSIEDERRLFFVAMTRAKTQLNISYSISNESGKAIGQSRFVDEVRQQKPITSVQKEVEEDIINHFQWDLLSKPVRDVRLIDDDLIDAFLNGFRLSVTALNKYLKCPLSFYFETVLKVPTARTKYMGFGKAVHDSLHDFYTEVNLQKNPDESSMHHYFEKNMSSYRSHFTINEFEDMTAYGKQVLGRYFDEYLCDIRSGDSYFLEVSMDHAEYDGIPLKGFLDKAEGEAHQMMVTDYKTGNPEAKHTIPKLKAPNARNEQGGDYWRQIIFYKILADSDKKYKWNIVNGCIDFVEPDAKTGQFKRVLFDITREDETIVGNQIKEVWEAIQNHNFDRGCDDEYCKWCNFVKSDFVYLAADEESDI